MSTTSLGALAMLVILSSSHAAGATCGDDSGDTTAVAAARGEIATTCNCATATTHGGYVACARGVVEDRVDHDMLPPQCRAAVMRCVRRSTCGRPGAVTCCRTTVVGSRCTIRRNDEQCVHAGGCVGSLASCCDACGPGGCVPTSTTTTLFPSTCGPSQYPSCGGTCPSGQRCVPFIESDCGVGGGVNHDCVCSGESIGCGDPDPITLRVCGAGPCPLNGVCMVDISCGVCGCSYPTTTTTTTSSTSTTNPSACGAPQYPSCLGDCPAGEQCVAFVIYDGPDLTPVPNCVCASDSQACGDFDPNGFFNCGAGPCPPDGHCGIDFFASFCGCVYP
jgi:hypothetical protein